MNLHEIDRTKRCVVHKGLHIPGVFILNSKADPSHHYRGTRSRAFQGKGKNEEIAWHDKSTRVSVSYRCYRFSLNWPIVSASIISPTRTVCSSFPFLRSSYSLYKRKEYLLTRTSLTSSPITFRERGCSTIF